jgi:hypothetical protein
MASGLGSETILLMRSGSGSRELNNAEQADPNPGHCFMNFTAIWICYIERLNDQLPVQSWKTSVGDP